MNSWIDFFYFFIGGAALLLSALGLWFIAIMPDIDRWSKNFFTSYFIVLMLSCTSGFIEVITYYYPVTIAAIYVILFIEGVFLSMPMPMLTVYLVHCCGGKLRSSKLLHTVFGLLAVYFVLSLSGTFIDSFCYITPEGRFHPGPLYSLLVLPLFAIMLLNLAGTIRYRARLSRKTFLSFIIAILPMTFTLPVHMFIEIFPVVDISTVVAALSMYGLILSDQVEQDLNRQREIANQRTSIMVLQMRPHFIYNTMTSIYCLCGQDPERARRVILDFTTYLRKNFTAIASAEPVPFTAELEHTRAYLAVEQAQYEESLFVEYDIPHKMFRVPPLTLQPIVENAIKHGRDPYAGPFRVFIRTRRTDSGSEIVVEDNGRGFDASDDSGAHTALKNIRERLEMMCGGEMTITIREGGGTEVKVTIPDSAAAIKKFSARPANT